jgi:flavin reductase (DIM6/NTAB) family NADH-FMN oxidoreductase RutF
VPEELLTDTHLTIEPSILYFGTPVALISTLNEDGTANLAAMSSCWALGYSVVLGLGCGGKTLANMQRHGECVISLPSPELWANVERLAPLTGADPVPASKQDTFRFEPDKFGAAGLTPVASELVQPPRVAECPLQLEAEVSAIHAPKGADRSFAMVETHVLRVHAAASIVHPGTHHVDTAAWSPLLYVFRHYIGGGDDLGQSFRAEI